ncbi:TetR family transcriptional regulator [Thalassotalea sp. G2M2-11]|uniref:TetR/AcrR family transcriptional regulator n=1 Tax=Thalassotalea sp. G2M2-11 TaxID=2787627 RepID=UPI0019D0E619|nr:TetR family transcriptional regulator [Thalassotalea sp. G2M2-11]
MSVVSTYRPVKRRSKGEQTRNQILQAAIEVLASQGIKKTTHRAIADHAQLQLSLTTYYFKDIQELVNQAFTLNASKTISKANTAWLPAFELVESYKKSELRKSAIRTEVADKLIDMATKYIVDNIKHNATELAVKQLLFSESQNTPQLRELSTSHQSTLLEPCIKLCRYFNKETATIDADIMLTIFTQLEFRNILLPEDELDSKAIHASVQRLIYWILQVKY